MFLVEKELIQMSYPAIKVLSILINILSKTQGRSVNIYYLPLDPERAQPNHHKTCCYQ